MLKRLKKVIANDVRARKRRPSIRWLNVSPVIPGPLHQSALLIIHKCHIMRAISCTAPIASKIPAARPSVNATITNPITPNSVMTVIHPVRVA